MLSALSAGGTRAIPTIQAAGQLVGQGVAGATVLQQTEADRGEEVEESTPADKGKAIASGGKVQETKGPAGEAVSGAKAPELQRPKGIPDNWVEQPSGKGGGKIYVNPNDSNDRVRVMPGNPKSPYPHQQKPYVVDQNGSYRDVNGNPIPGPNPKATEPAHIPYDNFIFKR